MKSLSVTLYKETLSKNQQVCAGKTSRFKWGKAMSDVTSRRDISFSAKVLLDAFSEHGKGMEVIALSQVFLAEAIGGERSTVAAALDSLEKAGLVKRAGDPLGHEQIQAYQMLHPALVRNTDQQVARQEPVKAATKMNLTPCQNPSCRKLCIPLKTGWCRKCDRNAEVRRIAISAAALVVRDELARADREKAMAS